MSSKKLRELRDRKHDLSTEGKQMLDKIESEKREMTADENHRYKSIISGLEKIENEIVEEERQVEEERARAEKALRAMDGGAGIGAWSSSHGGRAMVLKPDQRVASVVGDLAGSAFGSRMGASPDHVGFGAFVRAMVLGPRNESEHRALSEGTDSAGGFTVPVLTSAEFIDRLRAKATVIRAGARTVVLETDKQKIARLLTDPTSSWKVENALTTDTDPSFDSVTFDCQTLVSLVRISRELIEDSLNIEQALTTAFERVLSGELDRVALFGTGTAPEPRGVINTTGIGTISMGTNGAQISNYDPLLDALQTLQVANAADPTAAIMAPRTSTTIAKLKDTTNQPLAKPEALRNLPFLVTSRVPINDTQGTATNASRIVTGDFSDLMVGIRTAFRIEILRERYAENFQYGFLAHLRADIQLARPASFCEVRGIIP